MNFLKGFFSKIAKFFTSGKAEAAFNTAADFIPKAIPIVQTIVGLTPTKTDDQILAAFSNYNVAIDIAQIRATPAAQRGYLLLHLATEVLSKQLPGVATNLLNTAVQLAFTGNRY